MGVDQAGVGKRAWPAVLATLFLLGASVVFGFSAAPAGASATTGGPTASGRGGGQDYYGGGNGGNTGGHGGNNGGNTGGHGGNNGGHGGNNGGHGGNNGGHGGHGGHHGGHGGHGGQCNGYTPSELSINVPRAHPGDEVVISGVAMPGTTVVVSIRRPNGSFQQIGTAVVDSNGDFAATVTVPNDTPAGTAQIRVSAPPCPSVGTISLVIDPPQDSGSCRGNPAVVRRGQTVEWKLFNGFFDHRRRTTLTLVPRFFVGSSFQVYGGPYPNSGKVSFTVPDRARDGFYWVVQTGRAKRGGHHFAMACRVRVRGGNYGGGGGTTSSTSPSTTTPGSTTTPSTTAPGSTTTPSTTTPGSTTTPSTTTPGSTTTPSTTTPGSTTTAVDSATSTSSSVPGGLYDVESTTDNATGGIPTSVLGAGLERPVQRVSSAAPARSASNSSVAASSLARTGSTIRPFIVAAAACIAVGALLLLRSRRRS